MCYNISYLEKRAERFIARYKNTLPSGWEKLEALDELPTYYFLSGFVHPKLPIVKFDGADFYSWGLIPSWAKDEKTAKEIRGKTLNAMGETVFEKRSYAKSILNKRCIIGVSGFFEWREVNAVKYPYYIRMKDGELTSLGGIYNEWTNRETGEIFPTFSIVTTPANPMMETIHNNKKRMPLILGRKDEKDWIDPDLPEDLIKKLIKPFDQNKMTAYTVMRNVNSARNNRNVPEAIEEVKYEELGTVI